jgi:hypothetical protein
MNPVRFNDFYLQHYNRMCTGARLELAEYSTWREAVESPHAWAYMSWVRTNRHYFSHAAQRLILRCVCAHNRLCDKRDHALAYATLQYNVAYDAAVAKHTRNGMPLAHYLAPLRERRERRVRRLHATFEHMARAILVRAITDNPHMFTPTNV